MNFKLILLLLCLIQVALFQDYNQGGPDYGNDNGGGFRGKNFPRDNHQGQRNDFPREHRHRHRRHHRGQDNNFPHDNHGRGYN